MENETWKAIPGFEGYYEVSDLGRVRSLDRTIIRKNGKPYTHKGRILKQRNNKNGRLQVSLFKNRKPYNKYPHILVAEAFIGERPEGYDVCHIDGDYTNNKLSNIRFDTKSQNAIDIYRYGKKHGMGKLSIEQVLEIRKLYATGEYTQTELAERFGINQQSTNSIVNRKSFTWLNDDGTIKESQTAVS